MARARSRSRRRDPELVAVIDCGSSAVRASIAEIGPDGRRLIDQASLPVDLVRCLEVGRLDRQAMDDLVDALERVHTLIAGYGVARLRAVGTSALREISNRDVVLERIQARCGIELEVIESAEEARLYFEGLREVAHREKLSLRGKHLLVDVGAASSIMSVINGEHLIQSVDEHFGTQRTVQEFAHLHDNFHYVPTVERLAMGAVRMTLRRLPLGRCRQLFVSGPEVRVLAESLGFPVSNTVATLPVADLKAWLSEHRDMTRHSPDAEMLAPMVDPLLLVPAAAMVVQLCRELDLREVAVPGLNLRDGLLADMHAVRGKTGRGNRALLLAEARSLSTRMGMERSYAANTASLAAQIFDQTKVLHQLAGRERCLLEFAAWVHDVGSFVNVRNRHKHTLYLILSSDIAGLTAQEKAIVANVARYHRRSPPTVRHPEFAALPRHQRVVVSYLGAILRLAYGLDVDREQRIKQIACTVHGGRLLLRVDRRLIELERWSLQQKSDLFREVFGMDVSVVPMKES